MPAKGGKQSLEAIARQVAARRAGAGYSPSLATRAKLSRAHRGRQRSEEHRAAIASSLRGNRRAAGSVRTPEHRAAIAAAQTGENSHNFVHGNLRRWGATYATWCNMLQRCRDVQNRLYGGRGIQVCARWEPRQGGSFTNFLDDMGERPPNSPGWTGRLAEFSIDRIDVNGNYEPDNCRWATRSEQRHNQRPRYLIEELEIINGVIVPRRV